ncbi:hypothetical protein K443DRAFT_4081 [Laccaria amethystina LaAM-08-1]|uniref:Uncharacterized protein n=1 Tax=Laccaria amethystina LaAM-08-1 TaxID=1095629 RepID=A0A0C9YAM4_9AGAR|nr:hypothetical protein K443DRAFT_4081 [Laccaria amethystina LaAM-08-1]
MELLHPLPVLVLEAAASRAPCRLIEGRLSGSLVSAAMNIVLNQTSSSTLKGLAKILNHSFLDILIHVQQFLAPVEIIGILRNLSGFTYTALPSSGVLVVSGTLVNASLHQIS